MCIRDRLPEEAELEDISDTDAENSEELPIPKVDDILVDTVPSEPIADVQDSPAQAELPGAGADDFFKTDSETHPSKIAFTDAEESAAKAAPASASKSASSALPANLTEEIKSVLLYMDQLLEDLPEEKIVEFARSEQFATYKKLFTDLGLS